MGGETDHVRRFGHRDQVNKRGPPTWFSCALLLIDPNECPLLLAAADTSLHIRPVMIALAVFVVERRMASWILPARMQGVDDSDSASVRDARIKLEIIAAVLWLDCDGLAQLLAAAK